MDLTKAQRLINKIQAFLDNGNGHELSRLEKDLIKSYVQQLYEVITSEEDALQANTTKQAESASGKNPKVETAQKQETFTPKVFEESKTDPVKPFYSEYVPPVVKPDPPLNEYSAPPTTEQKSFEYTPPPPKKEYPEHEKYQPPVPEKISSYQPPEPELKSSPYVQEEKTNSYKPYTPVVENDSLSKGSGSHSDNETLQKLFDLQKPDEMASRFGHVPIASIESAMGLNERIFTLNELFGGDKALFDAWCSKLNSLNSFSEAKQVLISGPAKDFKWANPERIKMAEQFIRIVARRYPKQVS